MSGFEVKGWCPGALRPMMSGDGLVVRIRPRMARLSPEQARGVAAAAAAHGNGLIDLSARANVQLRGIRPDAHAALLADLDALGLIDPSTELEARRNIVVSPFWQPNDGSEAIASALIAALAAPDAPMLPGKFGFSIDPAQPPVLRGTSADIRIEQHRQGWLVYGEGFASGALAATSAEAAAAAMALTRWFLASAGMQDGRGRMAALAGRKAALPSWFMQTSVEGEDRPAPLPGNRAEGQLVGFEFGQMQADTLGHLARAGQGLRITPWRMVLIEGARCAPDLPGLITAPDDPRLRVTACTGAPACPQALQPTRALARVLAALVPEGQHLHVSGCAKGCAHPGSAAVTLCATATGFSLIRQGRAWDAAESESLPAAEIIASRTLFKAL